MDPRQPGAMRQPACIGNTSLGNAALSNSSLRNAASSNTALNNVALNSTPPNDEALHNVALNNDETAVVILDQSRLPNETAYLTLHTPEEMHEAILHLRVRGAPAIGICAAYCMYCLARQIPDRSYGPFLQAFRAHMRHLASSRPTAVNLSWALRRMEGVVTANPDMGAEGILALLRREAQAIHEEDMAMCLAISEHGLTLIGDGDGILTHCNAGPLATSRYGTALGPILLGTERGMRFKVFADETRPLLQGARLTAYELSRAGVDVTLICDNMASTVMKNGWIQACFVGCDRIAANGDTANKIGTGGVAILAKHYGIPFYVLGPTSSIDLACRTGDDIEIELRAPAEIREMFYREPMSPPEVQCYNPAFDVTDNALIAGIVTEHGICRPPYRERLSALASR